ncbi:hypothetical protein AM499_14350 [Bacillus sp. FJAT-22090]|uniref:hypothetical protein n=1 Tax=Bacillus sp. FJAT-22090 TaxID=1581038 RepID=UPI0006AF2D78|nr:hypothetical protein [Bacillus sp. FJAT-22090]ALC88249.1 hypothetical protein AM499_14350 [Bacillus sp. FJAT-22090]
MSKPKTRRTYFYLLLFILLLIIGITFWFISKNNLEPKTLVLHKTFKVTNELSEMVQESDVIVIGEYKGLDSKWNMAPFEQHENVEGHLFNFQVNETLKGKPVEKEILINHRYSEIISIEESDEVVDETGVIVEEAKNIFTKEVENKDPLYIKPANSEKYMIFLKENSELGHYYPAIEPFLIQFDSNDVAQLKSNLINLDKNKLKFKTKVEERTFYVINEIPYTVVDNISGKNLDEITRLVKTLHQ